MRRSLAVLALAALVLAAFGVWGALRDPLVVRYRVAIPGLVRPLRLVQISDSHASAIDMPATRLRRIVAAANALQPDLFVLTGDYISGNPADWTLAETRAAVAPFADLRASLGVVAVVGNHDDPKTTAAALAGTGVRLLVARSVDLGPLVVVGSDELMSKAAAVGTLQDALRALPPGRKPVIVLAHQPEFFQWLGPRPRLLIAGHSHGGQIMLPLLGTLPRNDFIDAHLRGLFHDRGQTMVVSSGLGTSVIPMRIGVPPEIVAIELVPAPYSVGRKSGTER